MGEKEGPPASGPAAAPERGIVLVRGDITRETVDAIVNAANSTLLGGGARDHDVCRDAPGDAFL